MLTQQKKFEILQNTSGHFLCSTIPDHWYEMTEDDQDDFLISNAWQPFEAWPASDLWEAIEDAAKSTEHLFQPSVSTDKDGWQTYFVEIEVRAGEYEKNTKMLIAAPDSEKAGQYAMYCESHDTESLEWQSGSQVADMGWEFCYTVRGTSVVSADDLPALEKYFNTHRFNANSLKESGNYLDVCSS